MLTKKVVITRGLAVCDSCRVVPKGPIGKGALDKVLCAERSIEPRFVQEFFAPFVCAACLTVVNTLDDFSRFINGFGLGNVPDRFTDPAVLVLTVDDARLMCDEVERRYKVAREGTKRSFGVVPPRDITDIARAASVEWIRVMLSVVKFDAMPDSKNEVNRIPYDLNYVRALLDEIGKRFLEEGTEDDASE